MSYPIFINCRDRVSCTKTLVEWLEKAGQGRIYLVDNNSTYEPLLEWYETIPHEVIRLDGNAGHLAPWKTGVIERYAADEYFAVSDPDIIPVEECPFDALDYFKWALDQFEDRNKVGFSLKIDDIPDHFRFKAEVIAHESQYEFWGGCPNENFTFAPIDTTFALYRPNGSPDISFSCRTKAPYIARHFPWYIDSLNPGEEEEYYISNVSPNINSWSHKDLPYWMK